MKRGYIRKKIGVLRTLTSTLRSLFHMSWGKSGNVRKHRDSLGKEGVQSGGTNSEGEGNGAQHQGGIQKSR